MLIGKQHSALSCFVFNIIDAFGVQVGELRWPDVAVATNARLKNSMPSFLNANIEIDYQSHRYLIEFEYLNRDWFNGIRFTLKNGDTIIASADVGPSKKLFKRPTIIVTQPFTGELVRKSSLLATRYEVIKDSILIGEIAEESKLTFKRKLTINLPKDISAPIQIFLFFLVCNQAYR